MRTVIHMRNGNVYSTLIQEGATPASVLANMSELMNNNNSLRLYGWRNGYEETDDTVSVLIFIKDIDYLEIRHDE